MVNPGNKGKIIYQISKNLLKPLYSILHHNSS